MKTKAKRKTKRQWLEHYEVYREEVSEILENLMYHNNLDRHELADKAGIAYSTVCRLFNGITRYPRFDTVWAICRVLECNISVIVMQVDGRQRLQEIG